MIRIHHEGKRMLFGVLIFFTLLNLLVFWLTDIEWIKHLTIIVSISLYTLVLQFFRNPKRNTVLNNAHVIAPADGKIVAIEEVEETEYFKEKRIQISIFMSPLNVHVNRYPISGEIAYAKYHPGAYLVAWHPKSSTLNERTTVVVKSPEGKEVLYKQIAGALARRIMMYAKPGTKVLQGTDSGFIKFGSRVDVLLPLDANVLVKIGDIPKGGETVLAELK